MSSKIRNWLYGWLGKKKFGLPTYKVTLLTTDDRTLRYRCELTVTGQSHVGVGISTNKKDAANSAAQDFIRFLIQQNLIDSWEIPDDSDFVSKNEIMESTSFDIPKGDKDAGNTSLMNEGTDTSLRKSVDLPSRMWTEDECYPDLRLDSTSLEIANMECGKQLIRIQPMYQQMALMEDGQLTTV
ncbi:unnamed protein product [Thelazia callipaeda]|uniref:DRBM domain-containing protein n=1 Tax=Thelazia callipaeda TaxID=103827 RepID=A0A0N5D270_THECL|nr:unnamed protein product [Thelazia callipaeda]